MVWEPALVKVAPGSDRLEKRSPNDPKCEARAQRAAGYINSWTIQLVIARLGCPAEKVGGALPAHTAVGAEGERRLFATPERDCLLGRPGLRDAEIKTVRDSSHHFTQRFLSAFDIHEAARRRVQDGQRIKGRGIGNMHV